MSIEPQIFKFICMYWGKLAPRNALIQDQQPAHASLDTHIGLFYRALLKRSITSSHLFKTNNLPLPLAMAQATQKTPAYSVADHVLPRKNPIKSPTKETYVREKSPIKNVGEYLPPD